MGCLKIAINGLGRIGKLVLREGIKDKNIEWIVNHPRGIESAEHVFKYDSVQGKYVGNVKIENDNLVIDGKKVKIISERASPKDLPWKKLGVDLVIECTGLFRTKEEAYGHIEAGAKKVVISAPGKGEGIESFVLGVNDKELNNSHEIVDNASCTTNCLAPVLKVLNDNFKIKRGFMTTIHGYTSDQNLVDGTHKDLRRARAAALNIVPTTTGASKAAGKVIPEINGKLDGKAIRVPVPVGSLVDVTAELEKDTTVEEINSVMKKAADTNLKGILEYSEEPIVSTDIIGNKHSSIFDSQLTKVLGGNLVQIVSWYDNEAGYAQRILELAKKLKA